MISPECDLDHFAKKLNNKSYYDILDLLEKETIEAQRRLFQKQDPSMIDRGKLKEYSEILKGLLTFLRFGIKPLILDDTVFPVFMPALKRLLEEKEFQPNLMTRVHWS